MVQLEYTIPCLPLLDINRMDKNTMRVPGASVDIMAANKPPKPPCWRDFVSNTFLAESVFTDISKLARSSNDSFSSDGHSNAKVNKPKRQRARIHRTRSQFAIDESDLPMETLTVTLAETKPDEIGLSRETSVDERIFQNDNNRKCQTWLRNIEASKPLEDVSCYDFSEQETEAVSLEIPDDTQCYDHSQRCHSRKTASKSKRKNEHMRTSKNSDTCQTSDKAHTSPSRYNKGDIKRTSTLTSADLINTG